LTNDLCVVPLRLPKGAGCWVFKDRSGGEDENSLLEDEINWAEWEVYERSLWAVRFGGGISGARGSEVLISVSIYSKIMLILSLIVGNQVSISFFRVPGC